MKLSKAIIKKYGISKKAWKIARGKKNKGETMTRRKKSGFRKSKSNGGSMSVIDVLMAGAIYGVARPMVSSALPSFFNFAGVVDSDNLILGGASYMASKQKGLIKAIGLIGMGTEAGIVTSNILNKQSATETGWDFGSL